MGVVDSRGSEPWVLGVHGYERASWVMVLHQSGLICLGVSVLVSGGPLPYQRWLCPSRSVYLVSSLLHLCSIQHLSSSALLSSIFLVVSSVGGSLLSAAKATSSFHWLAPAGRHSRWICPSHNNSLLISCPLFISICTSHNVTVTQSCNHVSSSLTSPWQHEATLVRYHGSVSHKYPVATRGHSGIKNLALSHLLWQHEATLVSLLATRGHSLISVESRAHSSPMATRGHFCYLLWNHGPTTVIWQHEAISFTCPHRACMKQNRRVDGVHWGGLGKSRTRRMYKK